MATPTKKSRTAEMCRYPPLREDIENAYIEYRDAGYLVSEL